MIIVIIYLEIAKKNIRENEKINLQDIRAQI
jgi:hypothetical protein